MWQRSCRTGTPAIRRSRRSTAPVALTIRFPALASRTAFMVFSRYTFRSANDAAATPTGTAERLYWLNTPVIYRVSNGVVVGLRCCKCMNLIAA